MIAADSELWVASTSVDPNHGDVNAGIRRPGKAMQRAAAERCRELLARSGPEPAVFTANSTSHSRGCAVVARMRADGYRIGIDIEYADPQRDWTGIIDFLAPGSGGEVSPIIGAAIWTVCEAVFKATAIWPSAPEIMDLVRHLTATPPGPQPVRHRLSERTDIDIVVQLLPADPRFAVALAITGPETTGRPVLVPCVVWLSRSTGGPAASVQRYRIGKADRL